MPTHRPNHLAQPATQARPATIARLTQALLLGALTVFASAALAQADTAEPDSNAASSAPVVDDRYESPQATTRTFLLAIDRWLDSPLWSRDASAAAVIADCMALEGTLERDSAVNKGERLLFVLNRLGEIDPATLPDQETASNRDLRDFVIFPPRDRSQILDGSPAARVLAKAPDIRIALQRSPTSGRWVFSRETTESITAIHRSLEQIPIPDNLRDESQGSLSTRLEQFVPTWLRTGSTLGLSNWQWLLISSIIVLGVITDFVVRIFLKGVWSRLVRRSGAEPDSEQLKRTVRPFGYAAAATVWFIGLQFASLPTIAQGIAFIAVRVVLTLAVVWAAWRVTDLASEFFARQAGKTRSRIDDLLVPLIRKALKILIIVAGVIYVAEALDIPVLPLLGGLGVGGLAFAFAAKDTIENLFGSVAVLLDRPFEVGDWIVIGDIEGTVEELGLRSTRIRTFYNSLITVPNATLVREHVDNYGRRRFRRFKTNISVTYDTPPERIEAFCEGIRELVRLHPFTRKDYYHVWLNSMGASSLDILVYMFHETPDWSTELRERHRFLLDVIRLAKRLGVEFAFPTQTLHLHQEPTPEPKTEPSSDGMPPVPRSMDRSARQLGMNTARHQTSEASWLEARPAPVAFDINTPGGSGAGEGEG